MTISYEPAELNQPLQAAASPPLAASYERRHLPAPRTPARYSPRSTPSTHHGFLSAGLAGETKRRLDLADTLAIAWARRWNLFGVAQHAHIATWMRVPTRPSAAVTVPLS